MKIKVIFRKWRDKEGAIIALFPELPHDSAGIHCMCYEHVGQHGAADLMTVMSLSKRAKPEEYADLKRELESAPFFYDLESVLKTPKDAYKTRRESVN